MEIRQLRYFVAVAEDLSFSRAARRIHVSQPPLSRQVLSLERELGVRLLERNNHSVALTAAGAAFLEQARVLLAGLEEAASTARRAAQGEVGSLVLGFGGSAAYAFMPTILRAFRARYPAVKVTLDPISLIDQLDALAGRRIDIGFVLLPFEERSIAYEALMRDRLVAAVPADHELAAARAVRLKDLAAFDFIGFTRSGRFGYHNRMMDICLAAGFAPRIIKETAPMVSVIGLVASGLGIAIVPSMAQRLQISDVRYIPILDRGAQMDFAFAWHRENASPVLKAFLGVARETIGRADGRGRSSGASKSRLVRATLPRGA
jgi:LysR family transcriptional regulator, benzoate and cis,cis-muconate-responsive activator of ben and cat genes